MTKHTKKTTQRRYGIERRNFIQYMAAISAIPSFAAMADEIPGKSHEFRDNPFTLGVASGDPEPDGVVIWTRLAPSPLTGDDLRFYATIVFLLHYALHLGGGAASPL